MNDIDPADLLFAGMDKLGPGGNEYTRHALGLLPRRPYPLVVDAGCGTGRQTLVLARELETVVHAIDVSASFLAELDRRAALASLDHLIDTVCMDMARIPDRFAEIDLLWSEGSAYTIGFEHALTVWHPAIRPGGFAAVSELSWLSDRIPAAAAEFFRTGYPAMRAVDDNVALASRAGYDVLDTFTLPAEAWIDGYYDVLARRAEALATHPEPAVREFAGSTLAEIETFESSDGSYGYVFFLLQRR